MKHGIDVSYAQGNIDFSKIDKKQVQFALIRSSFGWYDGQKDNQFERNYENFKKLDIPLGAYHYSYATTVEEAILEAEYCLKCIGTKSFSLPIFLDVEDISVIHAGKRNLTDVIIAFCERIKRAGYTAGFYINPNFLNNYVYKDELIGKYPMWLAHWGVSSPSFPCAVWQYKVGSANTIKGISGEIDLNYLYEENLTENVAEKDDCTKFLDKAREYIGVNGHYVCITKLNLGYITHWCAYAISAIMKDLGYVGKYIAKIEGGAGSIPRESDTKYGHFFIKQEQSPKAGDLVLFRYSDFSDEDKYFSSHIGIVESVSGDTLHTLEGNVDGDNSNFPQTSIFKRKTRSLSSSIIYAFYRPYWDTEKTIKTSEKTSAQVGEKKTTTTTANKTNEVFHINSSVSVDYTVKVTASDGLNIRQGAGTSFNILGAVPCNTVLKITNQTSGGKYKWGLTTYNGIRGWVALAYTQRLEIEKGSIVRLKDNATVYGTKKQFAFWVYQSNLQVLEIVSDRVVIGIDGKVTGAVKKSDLTLIT